MSGDATLPQPSPGSTTSAPASTVVSSPSISPAMIPISELPADAHVEFACPHCQIQKRLSRLSTKLANGLTIEGDKVQFHGITCISCAKRMVFEVRLVKPLPLPVSTVTP